MPSEHRKQELIKLLCNCVLTLAYANQPDIIAMTTEILNEHHAELERDYPGWDKEFLEQAQAEGVQPASAEKMREVGQRVRDEWTNRFFNGLE